MLQILFRRLAAPVLFPRDAQLLSLLLNADPSFILWQTLPFELDDLTNEYIVDLKDLTASRIAVLRGTCEKIQCITRSALIGSVSAIFSTCQKIFARQIITLQSIERSSAAVCREQQVDDQLLYSYLAAILSSMRDFLDSLKTSKAADGKLREYAAYCRQIIFLMKEEIGGNYVTEHNIPALRLLAGVINGTSI